MVTMMDGELGEADGIHEDSALGTALGIELGIDDRTVDGRIDGVKLG